MACDQRRLFLRPCLRVGLRLDRRCLGGRCGGDFFGRERPGQPEPQHLAQLAGNIGDPQPHRAAGNVLEAQLGEIEELTLLDLFEHLRVDRLDPVDVHIENREDQAVARQIGIGCADGVLSLDEQPHFLRAFGALDEARGDDRDEEARSIDRALDFQLPFRAPGNGRNILEQRDIAAELLHQLALQCHPQFGERVARGIVIGARIAPEADRIERDCRPAAACYRCFLLLGHATPPCAHPP